jgi:uncharacterized protein DUF2589
VITNQGTGYLATDSLTVTIADPPTTGTNPVTAKASIAIAAGTSAVPAMIQEMHLDIPILMILPIPFIRIEDTTIAFHANIHSVEYAQTDTSLGVNVNASAKQRWPGGSGTLNVNVAYQKKTIQGTSVDRTYSLDVSIHAVQDELPSGMDRVFGILESAMKSQPVGNPKPAPLALPAATATK